jgi:F-type H+-transporting ATPase subunit b
MFRITAYAMPVLYALLFWGMWLLLQAGKLPVFDYSFMVMVGIFWAIYFLAKRNLFDPLVAVMDRRERFVRERTEAHDRAARALQEARDAFDRRMREVRREEQAAVEALRQDLTARRDQAILEERQRMQRELEAARARLEEEGRRIRKELEPAAHSLAGTIVDKVLNRHVA